MALPPIYEHALRLYQAFEGEAIEATPEEAELYGVATGTPLFIGNWGSTFVGRENLARESTLQKAYAWLQDVGCLEVLKRGGRDHKGVVQLHRAPVFEDVDDLPADSRYRRGGRLGVVELTVESLVKRVSELMEGLDIANGRIDALTRDTELRLHQQHAQIEAVNARCPGHTKVP